MRLMLPLNAVLVILLCAGCGQGPPTSSPSGPSTTTAVTAPSTPAPSPVGSVTPSGAPSASPSASGAPTVPDPSAALDVSKTVKTAGFASFASPSGKIWCAIYATDALCHFPFDFSGKIPSSNKICPGDDIDVTGVSVDDKRAEYFCSGDPEADPRLDDSDSVATVSWWKATGWPSAKVDGQKVATLPYGKSLLAGDYVCASATNGVTCANTATGKGFRIARAGVTFIAQ